MSNETPTTGYDRLETCEGVSVAISYGAHPEEVLSPAGHLNIQTSGYTEVDLERVLPILRELTETFDLEFLGTVGDLHLRHLAGLTNLLKLNLSYGQVTDEGLQHLTGLVGLRALDLSRQQVTGAGLKHLAGLTNLRQLDLRGTQADDGGLEALSGLKQLTTLDLADCPVTDRGLEHLGRLTALERLDLSRTRVTGAGLVALAHLTSLRSLSLDVLPISDDDAAALSALVGLGSLSLHQTQVGDRGAEWLSHLPKLGWLTLSETGITDDVLRHLGGCAELINLNLDGTPVTGEGLVHLPEGLSVLSLCGTRLRPEFLAGLGQFQDLDLLYLDAAVADDSVCQMLRGFGMGPVESGSDDRAAFRRFRRCPLCNNAITEEDPVFVARPFSLGPDFHHLVQIPIHWDCYAHWEDRPRFARLYFDANVEAGRHNQFWGAARCDEHVLVAVNPSEYVREVQVVLAETGSDFRVHLDDWQDWLEGEWFEGCAHECEREALGSIISSLRDGLPTSEAVIEAAGIVVEDDGNDEAPAVGAGGMVGRLSYEFACDKLAERATRKGLACPRCGQFSNDYDYRRVKSVSEDGPQSCLVCKSCGGEFGPADV